MYDQTPQKSSASNDKRILPFFVEFVKYATGFAVIIATALIALQAASAAM